MWKRKEIKKRSCASLRQNYWRAVSVCFLIAMLTASYSISTTFLALHTSAGDPEQTGVLFVPEDPNSQILMEFAGLILEKSPGQSLYREFPAEAAGFLIDLFTPMTSPFFSVLRTVNSFVSGELGFAVLFPIIGILVSLLYQIFVNNILQIGEKRFFLETHNYHHTKVGKIFFLYKLQCVTGPAWIMVCRTFFQSLWNLTIIGGIIKHYEYIFIPYILAENPKISRQSAFFLSRQLTNQNKWKLFLLDLSLLGWRLLSTLTFGLTDFFFANPYITGCRAELYLSLRRNYVLNRSAGYECLSDSTLEHVPSGDELLIMKALYDDSQGPYTKINSFEPDQYPVFLFSIQPPLWMVRYPLNADRRYDFLSTVFLFYIFSFSGWLLETLTCLLRTGTLPEDLMLTGPWMPMYGLCGIFLLAVIKKLPDNPALVFAVNLIAYSVAGYTVNWFREWKLGLDAADYSAYFLNLNGRIFAGASVIYALVGCAFLYYLAPRGDSLFIRLPQRKRLLICVLLTLLFLLDLAFCYF